MSKKLERLMEPGKPSRR